MVLIIQYTRRIVHFDTSRFDEVTVSLSQPSKLFYSAGEFHVACKVGLRNMGKYITLPQYTKWRLNPVCITLDILHPTDSFMIVL